MDESSLSILIIRHAEKAKQKWPGPGLSLTGTEDDKSLVIRGWQRAGAWAGLFGTDSGANDYPKPSKVFAADPAGTTGDEPSQRPFQTVVPLADKLGLKIVADYSVGQELEIVEVITRETGVVLISWEHNAIAERLLPAIAGDQLIKGVPKKWDDERYDLVLRFDRVYVDAPWTFRQLGPCLLSGDSTDPMS